MTTFHHAASPGPSRAVLFALAFCLGLNPCLAAGNPAAGDEPVSTPEPAVLLSLQDDGQTVLLEVLDVTDTAPDIEAGDDAGDDSPPYGWATVVPLGTPPAARNEASAHAAASQVGPVGFVVPLVWDSLAGSLTAELEGLGPGAVLVGAVIHVGHGEARRTVHIPHGELPSFPNPG